MEIVKDDVEKEAPQDDSGIKYDPSKIYKWEPGSTFTLSGEEFMIVLNSLRIIINSPEAQRYLLADRAAKAAENGLARAVEKGIVKEDDTPHKKIVT